MTHPCRTHPVRVAVVALKLTDLVSISRNAATGRATWRHLSSKFTWCKRNDLTNYKPSIFLSVADFANHAKFDFVASVSCLRISNCNKRIKTTQPSVTVSWRVARWGQKGVIPPVLYCKYSNVEQKLLWPRKNN